MNYLFVIIIFLACFEQNKAQVPSLKKASDFSYYFIHNTYRQRHTIELILPSNSQSKISLSQVWIGNEFRDIHKLAYSDSHVIIEIAKKHPKNIKGKSPIKYKGDILLVYLIDGKTKYYVFKNPYITDFKGYNDNHPHLPMPNVEEY